MALGVCDRCRRFARGETCPFCGSRVGTPKAIPLGRRTRLGVLAATTVALAGCSSASVYGGPPSDAGPDDGTPITADATYGGVPYDAGQDTGADSGPTDGGDGG